MDDNEKQKIDVSALTLVEKEALISELTEALTKNIREAFQQAAAESMPGPRSAPEQPEPDQPEPRPIRQERTSQAQPPPAPERNARTSDEVIAFERSVEKGVASILKAQADMEKRLSQQNREGHTQYGKRIAASIDKLLEGLHEPHHWDISRMEADINKLATSITQYTEGPEKQLLTAHLDTLRSEFAKERADRATPLGRLQFLAERSNLNPVHAAASIFGRRHQGLLSVARFAAHTYSTSRERRHRQAAESLKGAERIARQLGAIESAPVVETPQPGLSPQALDKLKDIRKGSARRRVIEDLYRQDHLTDEQYEQLRAMYPEPEEPEEKEQARRPVRVRREPVEEDDEDAEYEPARPRRRRSSGPRRMSQSEVGSRAIEAVNRWETEGSENATDEELYFVRANISASLHGGNYDTLSAFEKERVNRAAEGLRLTYAKGPAADGAPAESEPEPEPVTMSAPAKLEPLRVMRPTEDKHVVDQVMEIATNIANPLPKSAAEGGMEGYATSVPVPGGGNVYNARYVVRELEDVQASHNPHNFEPNPDYEYKNDRNYSQAINAERVIRQAQKFDPRFLITDNPDAVNGPPITDERGNVLGGNSRAMTLGRVYTHNPEKADEYRAYLAEQAKHYGISPDVVRGMRNPVLVRLAEGINDPQQAITDLNKTGTAPLTASERAIADSRRVSRKALEYLGNKIQEQGEGATLINTLSGPHGIEIVNKLIEDGVLAAQERSQYIDGKRNIVTPEAKQRIARLMVGQFFENSSEYEDTPPELLQKLEKTVAPLSRVQDFPEWDLTPHVREAISILTEARAHGVKNLDLLNAQPDMGGNPRYNLTSLAIAKKFQEGPNISAAAFRKYANDAQLNKPGMPLTLEAPPTLAEAFKESFGFEPGEMLGPQEAEMRAKAAPAPVYTELAKPLRFGEDPEFVQPEGAEPIPESKPEAVPSLAGLVTPETPQANEPEQDTGRQWRVFHATDAEPANAFDPETLAAPGEPGLLGSGIYFSTDKDVGRDSRTLLSANVSLRNPLKLSLPDWKTNKTDLINKALGTEGLKGGDLTQSLKEKGYDGVTVDYSPVGYNHTEVMAMHPEQIRDVTPERSPAPAEPDLFGGGLFGGAEPEQPEPQAPLLARPEPEQAQPLSLAPEPVLGSKPEAVPPLMDVEKFLREPLNPSEANGRIVQRAESPAPLLSQPEQAPLIAPSPVSTPIQPDIETVSSAPERPAVTSRPLREPVSEFRAATPRETISEPKRIPRAGGPPYGFVSVQPGSKSARLIDNPDDAPVRRTASNRPEPEQEFTLTSPEPIRAGQGSAESELEPTPQVNLAEALGQEISDNLLKLLFSKLTKGDLQLNGEAHPVLEQANPWYRSGFIRNKEDLHNFVGNNGPLPDWMEENQEDGESHEPLREVSGKLDDLKKAEQDQLKELKDINAHLSKEDEEESRDDEQARLDHDAQLRNTQDWHRLAPGELPGERPEGPEHHSIWGALAAGAGEALLGGALRSILPGRLGAFFPGGAASPLMHHLGRWVTGGHEPHTEAGAPIPEGAAGTSAAEPLREAAGEPESRAITKYAGDAAKGLEATEEAGGFFGALGRMVGKFPILGMLGKIAGRLALPLTIIMGVIDFFAGFLNADVILGRSIKKISMLDRVAGGIGGVVKGLVGIVDMLFGLAGVKTDIGGIAGRTVGRLVDDLLKVVGIVFKVAGIAIKPLAKLLSVGFEAVYKFLDFAVLSPLEEVLGFIGKAVDAFSDNVDWLFSDHNPLQAASKALGGIKDFLESIVHVFESLSLSRFASWIGGFFHSEPAKAPASTAQAPTTPELAPGTGTPRVDPPHHKNLIEMTPEKPQAKAAAPADATKTNVYSDAPVRTGPETSSDQPKRATGARDYARIGALSTRYESRGDAGAVNTQNAGKDLGGYSYGLYQISTKAGGRPTGGTMVPFLKFLDKQNPEMGKQLESAGGVSGAMAGDPKFIAAWKRLAKDPKFADAQHQFVGRELYEPVARVANRLGLDLDHRSDAVKEMIFSTAVNGPAVAERILHSVFDGSPARNKRLTDEQVIERFQSYKIATADKSYRDPKTAAVMRERFKRETGDLIAESRPVPIPSGTDGAKMPSALIGTTAKTSALAVNPDIRHGSAYQQITPDTSMYQPKMAVSSVGALQGAQLRKASAENAGLKLAASAPVAPAPPPVISQRSNVVNNHNTLAADVSPRNNENTYQRNMDQMYYPT